MPVISARAHYRAAEQQQHAQCAHLVPPRGRSLQTWSINLGGRNYVHLDRFRRAVRARRGEDVHAERCPQVGRDQALLWSMLGSHVVDFSFF